MSRTLPVVVGLPLVAAALAALGPRLWLRRTVSFAGSFTVLGYAVALVVATGREHVLIAEVGDWPRPLGIVFAADRFSALMLLVAAIMVLTCTALSVARGEDDRVAYHPLILMLLAGVGGAFLTTDLFNLFVFFEVMLIASYVLLVIGGTRERVRAGAVYVTTNLLGSTVFLAGVALVYGETGTVNIAELGRWTQTTGRFAIGAGLVLAAFAVKAAIVPVHGWLPRSYPVAPAAVTALFSGLLTKVGVYAIYRTYTVVLDADPRMRTLLLVLAALTMVVGVLGAIGRSTMRDILAFHMVSQIGYILMGLGLFGPLGVAAGIFYMLQYILVKGALFCVAGAVETFRGSGSLSRLGGLARVHPVLASAFAVAALSLSGIPPLSGFFAKLSLVQAAFVGAEYLAATTAVAVSFFTLMSMVKIWNGVFWGEVPSTGEVPALEGTSHRLRRAAIVAPAVVLAALTLGAGIGANSLYELVIDATPTLLDPEIYIRAVVGR